MSSSAVASSANHVGVSAASWASCFQCGQALGRCLTVNGSGPYDQLAPFRSITVAGFLSEWPKRGSKAQNNICDMRSLCL